MIMYCKKRSELTQRFGKSASTWREILPVLLPVNSEVLGSCDSKVGQKHQPVGIAITIIVQQLGGLRRFIFPNLQRASHYAELVQ